MSAEPITTLSVLSIIFSGPLWILKYVLLPWIGTIIQFYRANALESSLKHEQTRLVDYKDATREARLYYKVKSKDLQNALDVTKKICEETKAHADKCEEAIQRIKSVKVAFGFYLFLISDAHPRNPICPNCFASDGAIIRLHYLNLKDRHSLYCSNCAIKTGKQGFICNLDDGLTPDALAEEAERTCRAKEA